MKIPLLFSKDLFIPITCNEELILVSLFNIMIGHPDESFSIGILCSNSSLLIFNTFPFMQDVLVSTGFFKENISAFSYIKYPFI